MIVHPITVASGDAQLATVTTWVPPGTWFDTVHGKTIKGAPDGSTSMTASYDLTEVPVFVRAGAVIPTIPVRTGATLGLATKQYTELEFSVYPGATAGSTAVYEDDAHTRNYLTGQFAWTNGSYTVANGELTFKAATTGHYDEMPTSRVFRLKIINGNAPSSVTVDGVAATFNVDGGPNTWRFCGDQMAVIVETKPVASTTIVVGGQTDSGLDGLRGAVSHAILSKRNLDETRQTLGAHKPQGGKLMDAASIGEYLEYLAGHDAATFKVLGVLIARPSQTHFSRRSVGIGPFMTLLLPRSRVWAQLTPAHCRLYSILMTTTTFCVATHSKLSFSKQISTDST